MSIFYKICLASAKFFSLGTGLAFASNAFKSASFSNLFSPQTSEFSQSTMEQIEKMMRKVVQEEKVNVFTDLAKFYVQVSVGAISTSIECIQTHPTFFMGIGLASSFVYYVKYTYESLFNDIVKTLSTPFTKCSDFFSPYWSKVKSYFSSSSSSSDQAGVAENIRDGFHEVNSNLHGMLTNDVLARSDVASILSSLSGEVLDKLTETNKNLIKSEDVMSSLLKEQESQKAYLVESLDKTFTIIHNNNEVLNNHVKDSMASLDQAFQDVSKKLSMVEGEQRSLKNCISYQSYQLESNGSLPASDPMLDPSFVEDLRTVFGDSVLEDRFNTLPGFPTLPSSHDSANSVLEVFEWPCFLETLLPLLYLFIAYTFLRSIFIYYMKK